MSPRGTFATAHRVLRQLRADHRTLAMLLIVPPVLMALLRDVFADLPQVFDRVGAPATRWRSDWSPWCRLR